MNIIQEIKKKVKPGQTVYYMEKNDKFDTKTLTDIKNNFEKTIKNKNNWHKILEAIYDETNSSYAVSPKAGKKDTFIVIDTKKTTKPAFEVEISIKDSAMIFKNLENKNKDTIIELASSLDSHRETPTAQTQVESLEKALKNYKNKSPKQLKEFLESVVNTL